MTLQVSPYPIRQYAIIEDYNPPGTEGARILRRRTRFGTDIAAVGVLIDTDTSYMVVDYRIPPDIPVTYWLELDSNPGVAVTEEVTVIVPSQAKDWLKALAFPALTRSVLIDSLPELTRAAGGALLKPLAASRAIPVLGPRQGATGTLTLLTLTLEERDGIIDFIDRSPVFLLQGPVKRGFGAGLYLCAQDYSEKRLFYYADEPYRHFVINVVEVDPPPLAIEPTMLANWQYWQDNPETWQYWRDNRTWASVLVPQRGMREPATNLRERP